MTDEQIIASHFPHVGARLAHLRGADPDIDTICHDLIALHREMAAERARAGGADHRYLADLGESFADLRDDIELRLKTSKTSNNKDLT